MIAECRAAYAAYEFHKVYHTLNQFCAVDLSSLYVDITKDRMYCDAPDSPRRRATQAAMREIFDALCRSCSRQSFPSPPRRRGVILAQDGSVHLQEFPEAKAEWQDPRRTRRCTELLKLRGVIGQAVEHARQEKLIGNALEAAVVLRCDLQRSLQRSRHEELEEFFILSDLKLEQAETGERLDHEDAASEVRALLAASPDCRRRARSIRNCAIAARKSSAL